MSDFHQTGVVTTLHILSTRDPGSLDAELERMTKIRPVALVLPSLFSELKGRALPGIIRQLKEVKYLKQIVVTLGGTARQEEFEEAKKFFSILPQETRIIWNNGKRIQKIYRLLEEKHLRVGGDGKGRATWLAYGYVLASRKSQFIALHDCDIINYDRELLARLCYPVVNPDLNYEFCKGYYSRVTDRMYGRVTRLFIFPLLRALQRVVGPQPLLSFLDSFRYPLAGEFSMDAELARINRIPGDWGLEVGILSEIFLNCSLKRVCQAELCQSYEHKHQPLSRNDPKRGLLKMSVDIAKTLFRTLASMGVIFNRGTFTTIISAYTRAAQDARQCYAADAAINGLFYDRHAETLSVEAFVKGLSIARETFLEDPLGTPRIPNWNQVSSAIPDIFERLEEAVEKDNR
jgi:glucosyl-3-phosphoglycerate synthase